jgi:hypothetical protein
MPAKAREYSLCPSCKEFKERTYRTHCGRCGTELVKKCPDCGKPFYDTGDFCSMCGQRLVEG